jgi:membrane-associated phospholipid phosphatase
VVDDRTPTEPGVAGSYPADRPPSVPVRIVATIVVAYCLAVFVLIADDVLDGGGLITRDASVLHWFVDHRTDAWTSLARVIGDLCGYVGLAVLTIGAGVVLWRRGRSAWLAAAPLVAVSLGGIASSVAKQVFDRPRPPAALRAASTSTAAFPSGHSTEAAACFLAIGLVLAIAVVRHPWARVAVVTTGVACAAVVGISRLVLAVHWLSDVVAGWALGTAVAVAVVTVLWWVAARTPRATVAAPDD